MIACRLHFEKGSLEAVRLARSGKLGPLRIFNSEFAEQVVADNIRVTEPAENGGGLVYDMGVYSTNAARYFLQAEPTAVLARSANNGEARFRKVDEMTSALSRFPEDQLATFTCSFGAADVSRFTLVHAECVRRLTDRNRGLAHGRSGIRLRRRNQASVDHWREDNYEKVPQTRPVCG
jgi:predicted dehydrogenase